jgi:hypothetical protein
MACYSDSLTFFFFFAKLSVTIYHFICLFTELKYTEATEVSSVVGRDDGILVFPVLHTSVFPSGQRHPAHRCYHVVMTTSIPVKRTARRLEG